MEALSKFDVPVFVLSSVNRAPQLSQPLPLLPTQALGTRQHHTHQDPAQTTVTVTAQ